MPRIFIKSQITYSRPGNGGSFRPFRDVYSLGYEGFETPPSQFDYEGTGIASLRRIGAKLAREHGAEFDPANPTKGQRS